MDRVALLCNRLRRDGFDCVIDQFEVSPAEGWPRWTMNKILESDFVLIVCTSTYAERFIGRSEVGMGLGVKWEGAIVVQQLYDAETRNQRFVPVVLDAPDTEHVPVVLRGSTIYDVSEDRQYQQLCRHLAGEPRTQKHPLGQRHALAELEKKENYFRPWNIELARNPYFSGRDEFLESLQEKLASNGKHRARRPVAVTGLGGVGKTQVAIEYAYRYRYLYDAVFLIRPNNLAADCLSIVRALDLSIADETDQTTLIAAVQHWLQENSGWLLIYDNVDSLAELTSFVPDDLDGHVLVTTRLQSLRSTAAVVELDVMTLTHATDFLRIRTQRKEIMADEEAAAKELANELDCLPLALEQAAAFILELNTSFADYLASLKNRGLRLLEQGGVESADYPNSVVTTWEMNFEQVERESRASADLLQVCAFLNADDIPRELFVLGASRMGSAVAEMLGNAAEDPIVLDEVLSSLERFSLVRKNRRIRTYDIHRLVQSVVIGRMIKDDRECWLSRTVEALEQSLPDAGFEHWEAFERFAPHVTACASHIRNIGQDSETAASILHRTGVYLYERGRLPEVESLYAHARKVREKLFGQANAGVAGLLNDMGELYRAQGKYKAARKALLKAVAMFQEIGTEGTEWAEAVNNLGLLYYTQGKFDKALPYHEQALKIRQKGFGEAHVETAESYNNLGAVYDGQEEYLKAEFYYKKALEIWEKVLGKKHPRVAVCLNNLAASLQKQGRLDDAEELHRRALDIWESGSGKHYPHIAASLANLAQVYIDRDDYEMAEPLLDRAVALDEQILGKRHRYVGMDYIKLAKVHEAMGRNDSAYNTWGDALDIMRPELQEGTPEWNNCLGEYIDFLRRIGKNYEAQQKENGMVNQL